MKSCCDGGSGRDRHAADAQFGGKTFGAILYSVRTGVIPEERIDESVYRILRLKEKYGILITVSRVLILICHWEVLNTRPLPERSREPRSSAKAN